MAETAETHPAERSIPFWRGLHARIFLTFAVVVVGLVAAAVTFLVRSESDSLQRETRKRGIAVARNIAWLSTPSLLSYNYVALNQAASRSQEGSEIAYVVIYDKEGMVAADSRSDNSFGNPPRDASDFFAYATRQERWRFLPPSRPGESHLLEIFLPVYVQGYAVKWGTVRIALSMDGVDREIAALTRSLILAGLLATILCLLAARAAAGGITRPLQRLVRATRAIAKGDYSQRVELKTGDELETLAWHFDHMADEVQRQQAEILASRENLARLNQTLEAAVEARTRALGESEAKYRVLVESAPQGIAILQKGNVVFTNPALVRMTGRSATELKKPGFDVASLLAPDSRAAARDAMRGSGSDGAQVPVEILHADGRSVHAELQVAPLVFQNESANMILLSDVSTLRDLQDRLLRGEKLRALGELAAGVAHDFNNNLGIILGRTQLLLMKSQDADISAGLNVIRQAAMDGGEAVRRIQQFTRVREDRAHEALDLPSLADEVVEITRGKWSNEAHKRGVNVDMRVEVVDSRPIMGSRAEIREALTNLIFNSVDALPRGGVIAIRCRVEGDEAVLEVVDDGIGMNDEVKSRMFEPFFTTKGMGGTGLGLSMVYGIVSRHRGTVEVETEPGRGTTIRMRFPATERPGAAAHSPVRVQAPFQARILVVDDEVQLLGVLRDALERGGHQVTTATSGQEGIDRFREERYDVVLTDLGMADVSGWGVAQVVRKEGAPAIVLGLVTGWGATISEEMVQSHGVNFVVNKPFDLEDLVSRVNRAMAARDVNQSRSS
jgi:PAS domain S-box-containing protein